MQTVEITKPIDFEYKSLGEALEAAEVYTLLGYEVTTPLKVAGDYCIRVSP